MLTSTLVKSPEAHASSVRYAYYTRFTEFVKWHVDGLRNTIPHGILTTYNYGRFQNSPQGICLEGPTEPDGASKSEFLVENYTTRRTDTREEGVLKCVYEKK